MSNIYLKITTEKKWPTQNFDFLKKCSKSIPGFSISRLANEEDFFNVNMWE